MCLAARQAGRRHGWRGRPAMAEEGDAVSLGLARFMVVHKETAPRLL